MAKIELDKYYTPIDLAKYCIEKTFDVIGCDNITEIIEPSAGNGSFSNQLECVAYDIEPEHENIIKQDYLKLDIEYKKGRLVIGNPPYGHRNTLSVKFFKKSIPIADYIAFILPISQLDNNMQMFEFDLVYSEDVGKKCYSGVEVHCCFNIYKRPANNINKKPIYKLNDVTITEVRMGNKNVKDYDIRIKAWGGAKGQKSQIGHEVFGDRVYPKEFFIKVHNDKYRDDVVELIKNVVWEDVYKMTATPNLLQWQVYKYIKDNIYGIK